MKPVIHTKSTNIITVALLGLTATTGVALAATGASALTQTATSTATIKVSATCSMTANVTTPHTATLINGTYSGDYTTDGNVKPYQYGIGSTTIQTFCNDAGGYSIYAIGYTGNTEGSTVLHGVGLSTDHDIITGTNTNGTGAGGDVSNWAMKLATVSGTYAPEIRNGFGSYSQVPANYTEVARLTNETDGVGGTGSSLTTTYAAYISNAQPAGTYIGQVKYILVHPNVSIEPNALILQDTENLLNIAKLHPGVQYTAVDNRDGKEYTVAYLSDGNLWMTQNLDLCIGCTGTRALTSENTDISTTASVYGSSGIYSDYTVEDGVYTWNPDLTAITSDRTISGTTVSGWTNSQVYPYSAEGGSTYVYTSGSTSGDTVYATLAKCVEASHTEAECKHYHVGNYYNWTSAIASNDSTNIGSSSGANATNSICPKGWRLPKATSPREFGNLLLAYNVTATNSATSYAENGFNIMRSDPLFFVRGGYVNGSSLNYRAGGGYYWSSTVCSSTNAYNLNFNSSNLSSANSSYRGLGFSVRCVARQ